MDPSNKSPPRAFECLRDGGRALVCIRNMLAIGSRSRRGLHMHRLKSSWPVVERLNSTLEQYPAYSFAAHIGSSLGTFGIACACLQGAGFEAPSLAVAGIVSRLTKRFRTPLDMSIAATLAHSMPWSNQLKLGPLLAAPMQAAAQQQSQQTGDGLPARLERGMLSFTAWAQGPVNSYGGPYMFVHWCTGLLTVSMTTAAVHHGLDITAVLSSVPYLAFDESSVQFVSGQASCVAGAMLFNTLSLPVRLYLLSLYGKPAFAALERQHAALALAIRSHHRKQLRGDPSLRRLEPRESRGSSANTTSRSSDPRR